jgi:hypothetical protein
MHEILPTFGIKYVTVYCRWTGHQGPNVDGPSPKSPIASGKKFGLDP